MATAVHIPVSEYLATSYRPDRDYVDGEVKERHLGERPHAALQGLLLAIFHANRKQWGIVAFPELRVQVSKTRYRIPDVSVLFASDPADDIVTVPPMICIEVLSPEDSISAMQERADDYTAMGVQYVWAFDPIARRVWTMNTDGFAKVRENELVVEGTAIRLDLAEVFVELDELTGK